MNKIRFIFLILVLILSIIVVLIFNTFKSSMETGIDKISEFKITQISGNGNVYFDQNPIKRKLISLAKTVDIKRMQYLDEIYLMTNHQASFEFYCFDTSFTVLPRSYLYYQPKTKELWFYQGEFLWKKEVKNIKVEISIKKEEVERKEFSPQIITLSDSGKLEIVPNSVRVWNYSGNLKFNNGSDTYNLNANNYLISVKNQRIRTLPILHSPEFISPEKKILYLSEIGDSVVKFNWKIVKGAQRYILRLYSSKLMENLLYERDVDNNRLNLDLLQFEDFGVFYWQVFAYDPESNMEGTPSKMGYLKLKGALLNKEKALRPPEVIIKTLDVNGNLVLIDGETDKNAQLIINDIPVTLNTDGTFTHTITFKTIGRNKIVFRVISASGIETTVEKYATTYDE